MKKNVDFPHNKYQIGIRLKQTWREPDRYTTLQEPGILLAENQDYGDREKNIEKLGKLFV
jgi:hypothetical protein